MLLQLLPLLSLALVFLALVSLALVSLALVSLAAPLGPHPGPGAREPGSGCQNILQVGLKPNFE